MFGNVGRFYGNGIEISGFFVSRMYWLKMWHFLLFNEVLSSLSLVKHSVHTKYTFASSEVCIFQPKVRFY